MRVVRNDVARLTHHTEQNALGGAALMRGDYVRVAENLLHGSAKTLEAPGAGVAFVAAHDRGPLLSAHGAGAGIGKQINQDVISRQKKEIVVSGAQHALAFIACRPADRFNTLDAKRL